MDFYSRDTFSAHKRQRGVSHGVSSGVLAREALLVLLATLVVLLVERVSRCVLCRYCTKREPTRLRSWGGLFFRVGFGGFLCMWNATSLHASNPPGTLFSQDKDGSMMRA